MTRQDTHLDCSGLKTYSIFDRNSLVSHKEFARPWERGKDFSSFLDTLPSILAGNDIRTVIQAVATAAQNRCPVCFAMGGHVIKPVWPCHNRSHGKTGHHLGGHERGRHHP